MNSRYKIICHVAKETLGMVQLCYDLKNGNIVAKKTIPITDRYEGIEGSIIDKVTLSLELKNLYIVKLLNVQINGPSITLTFEHFESDMNIFIRKCPPMTPFLIQRFLYQILHGIAYFNSLNLFHGDLKPDCVLVDTRKLFIKIADVWLAKPFGVRNNDRIHLVGDQKYRAPEILLGDRIFSSPVDMWAVGCIFAEMMTKKPLFPGNSAQEVLHEIFRLCGVPNEDIWPGVTSLPRFNAPSSLYNPDHRRSLIDAVPAIEPNGIDLLNKMLCLNPVERITARAALAHPYFECTDFYR